MPHTHAPVTRLDDKYTLIYSEISTGLSRGAYIALLNFYARQGDRGFELASLALQQPGDHLMVALDGELCPEAKERLGVETPLACFFIAVTRADASQHLSEEGYVVNLADAAGMGAMISWVKAVFMGAVNITFAMAQWPDENAELRCTSGT